MTDYRNPVDDTAIALQNCATEPVQTPGRVQSFAAVLGVDRGSFRITHFSENLPRLFPQLAAPQAGDTLKSYLPDAETRHAIRGALGLPTIAEQRERLLDCSLAGVPADLGVYASGDRFVIDLRPAPPDERPASRDSLQLIRGVLAGVESGNGWRRLLDTATVALRRLTGFDRVMAYRFFPNDDGEVVAEARSPGADPYLGLRYPAADIPAQTRQLMLRSIVRTIADVDDPHARVHALDAAGPLDLSLSHARGVSPIHVEYLRNMGVKASMNTSLIVDGRLWGLFGLHHSEPRTPSPETLSVAELFGQLMSMHLQQELEREAATRRARVGAILDEVRPDSSSLPEVLDTHGDALLAAADWDGVALVSGVAVLRHGDTPDEAGLRSVTRIAEGPTTAFDRLPSTAGIDPATLGKTAGAIVQRSGPDSYRLFCRNEVLHELRWAGSTTKEITHGPNGPRLMPRSSFAEYKESVAGACREWTRADEATAARVGEALGRYAILGAHGPSRAGAAGQQDLLIAELNHRVRNTLALVRSLARQSAGEAVSVEQYVQSLGQRISALAAAHDLAGGGEKPWAPLGGLVRAELGPYLDMGRPVTIEGEPWAVRADIAPIVALMLHEMAANAVRHGGLSEEGESLRVAWRGDDSGLAFHWRETLTRDVDRPEREGFGLTLIERAAPHECGGESRVVFADRSVEIDLRLPIDRVSRAPAVGPTTEAPAAPPRTTCDSLAGVRSALVLEDNTVLAMEMESLLRVIGVEQATSVATLADASRALGSSPYDLALLDINLDGETSFAVGAEALASGAAVVFVTGYDTPPRLPDALAGTPRLTKPVGPVELRFAIERALGRRETAASERHAD